MLGIHVPSVSNWGWSGRRQRGVWRHACCCGVWPTLVNEEKIREQSMHDEVMHIYGKKAILRTDIGGDGDPQLLRLVSSNISQEIFRVDSTGRSAIAASREPAAIQGLRKGIRVYMK